MRRFGADVILARFLAPPHVLCSVAMRVYCDAFGLSQGDGPCYRLLDLWFWAQVLGSGSGLWLPHGGSRRHPHRALLLTAAQRCAGHVAQGTQSTRRRAAPARGGAGEWYHVGWRCSRCGSSTSKYAVLAGFFASLPLYDQLCSRAREAGAAPPTIPPQHLGYWASIPGYSAGIPDTRVVSHHVGQDPLRN